MAELIPDREGVSGPHACFEQAGGDGARYPVPMTSSELVDRWAGSSLGLAVVDRAHRVVDANRAFAALLNAREPLCGTSLTACAASMSRNVADALECLLEQPHGASLQLNPTRSPPVVLHLAALENGARLVVAENHEQQTLFGARDGSPAGYDSLTGLGNREMFEAAVDLWNATHSDGASLALILVDLDRFKQVNDTLGHAAGDTLLTLAAKRLRSATRADDTLIRFGGDEFVVLHTSGQQPEGAASVGERVIELMSRPFLVEGQQVNIGASVGIALSDGTTEAPLQLLKRADLALYDAKDAGRGKFRFFEPRMAQRAQQRRQMELSLRRALSLKEFTLHYQPQVSLQDGRTTGFEALIRWKSSESGLVSPADFIPLAEEIGEIHAIGEWVIREACREAASWSSPLAIAVNVSPVQFDRTSIVDVVRSALESTMLAPERLELEITEGVLMTNTDEVMECLWAIRDLGVGIAMDDFGTGYSSLSHLNSFPFSKLKIDQSFIRSQDSHKSRALIEAILALGGSLGLTTIAEGIETRTQYEALARSGCASAQGYLIGRPMPADQIPGYLANAGFHIDQWEG